MKSKEVQVFLHRIFAHAMDSRLAADALAEFHRGMPEVFDYIKDLEERCAEHSTPNEPRARIHVAIEPDGRCACSCADECPLGKTGMGERCTADELVKAGCTVSPSTPIADKLHKAAIKDGGCVGEVLGIYCMPIGEDPRTTWSVRLPEKTIVRVATSRDLEPGLKVPLEQMPDGEWLIVGDHRSHNPIANKNRERLNKFVDLSASDEKRMLGETMIVDVDDIKTIVSSVMWCVQSIGTRGVPKWSQKLYGLADRLNIEPASIL